jgi:hypothetical protein
VGAYLETRNSSFKATGGPAPLSRPPEMARLRPHEVLKKLGLPDLKDHKQLAAALRRLVDRGCLGALVQEVGAGRGLAISNDRGLRLAAARRGAAQRTRQAAARLTRDRLLRRRVRQRHRSGRASCWASSRTT